MWWPAVVHFLGLDYGAPYGRIVPGDFWSGIGSDLSEVTLLAAAGTWWRHANCEVDRCWRLGRHQTAAGHRVCRRHHPDGHLTASQVADHHHQALRRGRLLRPLRRVRPPDPADLVVPAVPGHLDTNPKEDQPMPQEGIDVAWPQGAHFPWASERGKISFGMAKATEGLNTSDPDFAANWNGMWALSRTLPRFAYHYFHASEDPAVQAERLVAAVRAHGLLAGDNFVLDLEATSDADGLNDHVAPAVTAARARTFLNTVNGLAPGHRVLVYTSPSVAETGACAGLGSWYLWLASYGVSKPKVPQPWSKWTFWQYSGTGLDHDRFNGTEAQLLRFCRMPATR